MDMMKAAHPSMMAMCLQAIGIFGITYFNEPGIFKPMVNQMGASAGPTKKNKKKLKPNDKCFCGSGKKLKKCCKTAP